MSALEELKTLYRDGRLIPFVGAGVSMSVVWDEAGRSKRGPSWGELVDEAAKLLDFDLPALISMRGDYLQILEYFKLKNGGLQKLTNWLYANMRPPDASLLDAPVHRALAALTRCSIFYTTNYDDFLERSLQLNGRTTRVVALESHMGEDHQHCEVIKFHGDWNHPSEMVVTESDYHRRLSFTTPMDFRFRADVLGRALLFIGYSFKDSNVAYLFRLVNEYFGRLPSSPSGRRAYIVVNDPSDFERTLFGARNMEVIPVRAREITNDISDFLTQLAD